MLLAGVRDFPAQMGAGAGAGNFTAEARFGADWLLRMWDDRTRTLYYQVGIGTGNDEDDRRPRHLAAAAGRRHVRRHRPAVPVHPQPPGVPGGAAGLADQPQPGRPRRRGARALLPGVPDAAHPAFAEPLPARRASTSSTSPTRTPTGDLLTAIPFSFYPETEWRDDLELGATELASRRERPPAGCPHTDLRLPATRHWAHAYITARTTPPTRSTSTTSAGSRTTSCTARSGTRATRPGFEITQAALLADMRKALDRAVAQAAPTRSGSGSRGRSGTRRRTAPGCR